MVFFVIFFDIVLVIVLFLCKMLCKSYEEYKSTNEKPSELESKSAFFNKCQKFIKDSVKTQK